MATSKNNDMYSYLDQLSTEELRQLLCADIDSPVNGDDEAIFYILEVIESREQAHPSSPFPDLGKSWKEFPMEQKWFAVGETIAHLDYLRHENVIKKVMQDSIYRYYFK